jgi:ribokinase
LPEICETSIIKLGGKGSIILCGGETIRIPVFPAKVVDTTGAGDSYIGTYLGHIAQGASVEEAGIAASRKAAEIVGRIGAR